MIVGGDAWRMGKVGNSAIGRVFMGFSHLQNQMVDFTYRYVSFLQTHKVIECQIECQIEHQLEFQNICQLQCQTECQIARIHVR